MNIKRPLYNKLDDTLADILSRLIVEDALWQHPWREPHSDGELVSLLPPNKNYICISVICQRKNTPKAGNLWRQKPQNLAIYRLLPYEVLVFSLDKLIREDKIQPMIVGFHSYLDRCNTKRQHFLSERPRPWNYMGVKSRVLTVCSATWHSKTKLTEHIDQLWAEQKKLKNWIGEWIIFWWNKNSKPRNKNLGLNREYREKKKAFNWGSKHIQMTQNLHIVNIEDDNG